MFSKSLEMTLNLAFARARENRHEELVVEHLLLALLDNPEAREVLVACGAEVQALREELSAFIDETAAYLPPGNDYEPQPGPDFQRVLQRAIFQVQAAGRSEVTGANVLAAIFSEQQSQAVYFLSTKGVTRLDVMNYIAHGLSQLGNVSDVRLEQVDAEMLEDGNTASAESALDCYAINLNERVRQGKVDPVIGRKEELSRAIQVLCRRRKNNPLFVGEAGVGKTAIAEGLAIRVESGEVPSQLKNLIIYSLDIGALLAGTKYRGDFEKRFKALATEWEQRPDVVVFIDEIHILIGAGAASGGSLDASNLLKPLLSRGNIRCMGATTYQEYRTVFTSDRALSRRFQKIDIKEPSVKETYRILKGLRKQFEEHHNVKFTRGALRAAAELSARHITESHLPDKAIDVIDEAAAYQTMLPEEERKKVLKRVDIEEMVAKLARVPSKHISASDEDVLKHLERDLKMLVFGQDKAIKTLCGAIKLSRSGLRDEEKPIGSFLFAGPTGVGKTEVSKQLAEMLGIKLLRFDMSEYMEQHTASRLIGAPPGYVGFEQGGLLTEEINKNPHAVLLLDEIEKAHPDLFNLMLQVMDYGKLTDNNGQTADFRNIIVIMTTNVGAAKLEKSSIGFTQQDLSADSMADVKRAFSPEFRNRLDGVIQFNYLEKETIKKIVNKVLIELEAQLEQKNVTIEVNEAARAWLAENGYDRKMGARPMARLVQEHIKQPLAEELLFGKLKEGGHVNIFEKDGKIDFDVTVKETGPTPLGR